MKKTLLDYLRCPLCQGTLAITAAPGASEAVISGQLHCTSCGQRYPVEAGIPTMLAPQMAGYAEKMREAVGWVAMAQAQGWYEANPEIDAVLPDVVAKLGWDPAASSNWVGAAHSFHDLLARFARPGLRVLEIGAAKTWAGHYFTERGCTYTGCDLMTDPQIGLGRAQFFREQFNTDYEVVTADAEKLPFAEGSFDLVFAIAALHHALDLPKMVGEMARVTKRGGVVAGLNEGVRAFRASPDAEGQATEKGYGINEHVYTLWDYYTAFRRQRLQITRIYRAAGNEWFMSDQKRRRLNLWRRLPWLNNGVLTALLIGFLHEYDGLSIYSVKR